MTHPAAGTLAIVGGTIIDGNGGKPIKEGVVLIQGKRICAVGDKSTIIPSGVREISAFGKYVIPGLMDANVHLLGDIRLENLARHMGHYEDLITEAAQVALRNGLTTVFDTWGPRRFLITVRDRINAGRLLGSRIFCAGNIIGFDGPFSADFQVKDADVASDRLKDRINAIWAENVGRHLMWLAPEQVASEVRTYLGKGIDFIKFASNDHAPGSFLAFSERVQATIVEEAHRATLTAQAHTMSVEGLRIAIEAGCDLIQHTNITGPIPIPEKTLALLAARKTGAVVFPWTKRRLERLMQNAPDPVRMMWKASDTNVHNLIECGASLLMGFDASLHAPEVTTAPVEPEASGGADGALVLGNSHFEWFISMEEKGCSRMRMLQAATRNVAVAYGKDKELGTLEPGKIADLLILDEDPLRAAVSYRRINVVIKEGVVIDRAALPSNPILTRPAEPPLPEEKSYVPFSGFAKFPACLACAHR